MRLDRFVESKLSHSAQTVRRLLAQQHIVVNGIVVLDGWYQITHFCHVAVSGVILQARQTMYVMLHKPKGCVSATSDVKNKTVIDCLELADKNQLHIAGRLDFNSTGLLLLTNDGHWSRKITQPLQKIPKTYWVQTKDEITPEYVKKFLAGFYFSFENLTTLPAELIILSSHTAQLTIYEGRYHQIKRMFGFFQNEVLNLHRLSMGSIALDASLAEGQHRLLTPLEINSIT